MRVSTSQLFDLSIQNILENQGELVSLQEQLATGKRLINPSDDPVGSAQVIRLTEELEQITQYQRNNDLLQARLETEEAVLQNINTSLDRARVLMIQSGSGVIGEADRQAIAIEIEQIRDEVFDLMNTRDANGEYIFAGYQSSTPAFSFNASNTGNKYTFDGDEGVNVFQLSSRVQVEGNSSGKEIFEDVFARFNASISATAGVTSASLRVSQQSEFDQFFEQNYDNATAANNTFQITIDVGGNTATVVNSGTGVNFGTQNFTSGEPFVFNGIEFTIEGVAGDTVDFDLDAPEKKNIAETLNDFATALNDETISDFDFEEALADAIVGIDNGMVELANGISSVGGRLNVADSVFASNLDLEITNKAARSDIEDADYAETVSELSKQETALQAAQSTFSIVTQLSLFDFI